MIKPIRKLDESVSNKIAAGEVVERPASIIKELVENSIDAGSSAITVEIKDGGINYIRVVDNGCGINAGDVAIAFERHTTNKIIDVDDLYHIGTMGFRGEALCSIAAVSQVELITRTADSDLGVCALNNGGAMISVKPYAAPEGTAITVKNLFYNTPARRKFLKKPAIEASYVTDLMSRFILGNPGIAFRYISNGQAVFFTNGDGDMASAIAVVYGGQIKNNLIKVDSKNNYIELQGYVGNSSVAKANRTDQTLFVNGRYIRNAAISGAVQRAFDTELTIGKFPFYVLNLKINTELVDVNVHPNKMEIKFPDYIDIAGFVYAMVKQAVQSGVTIKPVFEEQADAIEEEAAVKPVVEIQEKLTQVSMMPAVAIYMGASDHTLKESESITGYIDPEILEKEVKKIEPKGYIKKPDAHEIQQNIPDDYTITGVLFGTYIMIEYDDTAYIIDQHAAHERLLYEKFLLSKNDNIVSQRLLSPVIFKVSASEYELLEENAEFLNELGFDLEPFGPREYKINAVPIIFGEPSIKSFFDEFLSEAGKQSYMRSTDLRRAFLMQLACKKAVKARDRLDNAEIRALIRLIKQERIPLTCPHGRPILLEMSRKEIEKKFKRIQ